MVSVAGIAPVGRSGLAFCRPIVAPCGAAVGWVSDHPINSSKLRSCCRRCCSVAAVRLINCCLSWSYGVLAGGERMRSRTSVATSGANDETTWSNFVLCCVMCLVVNCASICANHSCGSVGQNGGILRLVIATVGIALVAGSAVGGWRFDGWGFSLCVRHLGLSRRGHQCR